MRPLRNTERVMMNSAVERVMEIEREAGADLAIDDIRDLVSGVYPKVMREGDMESGAWSCGMVAGLIHDIPTCKDLVEGMVRDAEAIIRGRLSGILTG